MALTKQNIGEVEALLSTIERDYQNVIDRNGQFDGIMADPDFSTMLDNTDFGADKKEQLMNFITLINSEYVSAMDLLLNDIRAFLDNQLAINISGSNNGTV